MGETTLYEVGTTRVVLASADETVSVRVDVYAHGRGIILPGVEPGATLPRAALPALINALLRLCTHAQLGEVVVPRRAGEWKRGELCAERLYVAGDEAGEWQHFENRHQAADGLPFTAGWTAEAPVMAVSYSSTGGSVTTWHPTRAEAEAAVDERLRADGVVLP